MCTTQNKNSQTFNTRPVTDLHLFLEECAFIHQDSTLICPIFFCVLWCISFHGGYSAMFFLEMFCHLLLSLHRDNHQINFYITLISPNWHTTFYANVCSQRCILVWHMNFRLGSWAHRQAVQGLTFCICIMDMSSTCTHISCTIIVKSTLCRFFLHG